MRKMTYLFALLLVTTAVGWADNRPDRRVERNPAAADAAIEEADKLYRNRTPDNHAAAAKIYRDYIAKFPEADHLGLANFRLGEILLQQGKPKEAERCFAAVVATKGIGGKNYFPLAVHRLGSACYNRGEFARAADHFLRAEKTSKNKTAKKSAQFYAAKSLNFSKQTEKAVEMFKKILERKDRTSYRMPSMIELAKVYIGQEKLEEARLLLEALASGKVKSKRGRGNEVVPERYVGEAKALLETLGEEKR